jgi:cytoskeleton protein RodZ
VDEIEKLTHIRARYLIDMEDGNFNDIPSLVQARGLLTGYASFLNLDVDGLLGTFAEALQTRRLELLPPEPVENQKKKKKMAAVAAPERTGIKRFFTVDLIIGIVTIFGLLIFGIWSASRIMSSRKEASAAPPPISDVLMQNPTSESGARVTVTAQATDLVRNPESIGQLPTTSSALNNAVEGGSPTPPVPSLGTASMQVYIVPNQRVFLQVTAGKKVVFLGRTIPGNAYPFTSDDRIEVISGDAAALKIYYNQRDLGTLGLPGQTLRLIFSKDGISTPTAMVTTAPSATPMPTLTLRPTATIVPPTVTPLIP